MLKSQYAPIRDKNLEGLTERYLLYMLYHKIFEIPNSHANYIIWLGRMQKKFNKQRENGIKDFIEFLMREVYSHIAEGS